jgi:hypothetical protein
VKGTTNMDIKFISLLSRNKIIKFVFLEGLQTLTRSEILSYLGNKNININEKEKKNKIQK